MSTGTVQAAENNVIRDLVSDALQLGFTNDSGGDLSEGQEVIFKTNGKLDKRDAGTELPVGIVVKGGANGEKVTIRTFATAVIMGVATGGAIEEGTPVKPNGSLTSGVPQYVAAVAGDYCVGIACVGAAQDASMRVMIMNAPFQLDSDT